MLLLSSRRRQRMVAVVSTALVLSVLPVLDGFPGRRDASAALDAKITWRVSLAPDGSPANDQTYYPELSANGRYVAFESRASNLVAGDTNGVFDMFVYDQFDKTVERVSVGDNGQQAPTGAGGNVAGSMTPDARYVAFHSADNLVAGDTNGKHDVFVRDRTAGTVERVSVTSSGGQGDNVSQTGSISSDGQHVAFQSTATNMAAPFGNFGSQIFVRDLDAGTTVRVSVMDDGTPQNESAGFPVISGDGRYVAFRSDARNLGGGNNFGWTQIYVHDRDADGDGVFDEAGAITTKRISTASNGASGGNGDSREPVMTPDGRFFAYQSRAYNLISGQQANNSLLKIVVHDRDADEDGVYDEPGATVSVLASKSATGAEADAHSLAADISQDGAFVAFASFATNLVPGKANGQFDADVFVYDVQAGSIRRASVTSTGAGINNSSEDPALSGDGRYVAYHSDGTNVVPGDTNGLFDIFVTDSGATPRWEQTFGLGTGQHATNPSGTFADPVNTLTGSFVQQEHDLSQPAPGLDLDFSRTYNSADSRVGRLGRGWTHSYDVALAVDSITGDITLRAEDGQRLVFTKGAGGTFTAAPGGRSTLAKVTGGYELTRPDGIEYRFDDAGKLTRIENPEGKAVDLTYTGEQLTTITDAAGRTATLTYHAGNGRLATVTFPGSRTVSFSYTGELLTGVTDPRGKATSYEYTGGLLTKITDPRGKAVLTNTYGTDGRVTEQVDALAGETTFGWDPVLQKATITDAAGRSWSQTYSQRAYVSMARPGGGTVSITRDANLNPTVVTDGPANWTFTYDAKGRPLTSSSPSGLAETYTYDAAGRMSSVTDAGGDGTAITYDADGEVETVEDRGGNTTTWAYDADGNAVTKTDALAHVTTFDHDAAGRVVSVVDARGKETTYAYDAVGNVTSSTDPLLHTTTRTYDDAGNLTTVTDHANQTVTFTYNDAGEVATMTDAANHTTTYGYDAMGNLVSETDAAANVTTHAYDTLGRRTSTTDAEDNTTTFEYDAVGNLTGETNDLGKKTTYTYDAAGNLLSKTDPLNHTTTFTYDAVGNRLTETDPLNHTTTWAYDAVGNVAGMTDADGEETTFEYDAVGNLVSRTDPLLNETTYGYDAVGNRVSETDPLLNETSYDYDAVGNVVSVTDANGDVTTYDYDGVGNVISEVGPLLDETTFAYDEVGNLLTQTDAMGRVTSFGYDDVGRLLTETSPTGRTTSFEYDGAGRLTSQSNSDGDETTYGYDDAGRRTSAVDATGESTTYAHDDADRLVSAVLSDGTTTTYGYDDLGRTSSVTDQDGTVTFGYDAASNLTSRTAAGVTTTFGYDAAGRRTSETVVGKTTTFTYDAVGNLLTTEDPLGHDTTHAYDELGRVTSTTDARGNTTSYGFNAAGDLTSVTNALNKTTSYTYDAAGNLLTRTDPKGAVTAWQYDAAGRRTKETDPLGRFHTYSYDTAGHLVGEVSAAGNATPSPGDGLTTYGRDAAGRVTSITYSDATTYSIDALEAVTDVEVTEGPPDVSFTYDAAGRRTSMTDRFGTESYVYDGQGRLKEIKRGAEVRVALTYDTAGRVTRRAYAGGTAVDYVYDGSRLASVTEAGRTTSFTYDAAGRLAQRVLPNGVVEDRTYDDAGSLTRVRSAKGAMVLEDLRYTLDPVGNPVTFERLGRVESFEYDAANRVTASCIAASCAGAGSYIRYTYDEVGNRTEEQRPSGTTTYSYDLAGQLLTETRGGQVSSYEYDPDGNQIKKGALRYAYDAAGQMVASVDGLKVRSFGYDGDGHRATAATSVVNAAPVQERSYVWDPTFEAPEVAVERDTLGQTTGAWFHGGGELFGFVEDGDRFYTHPDRIGSVMMVTDAAAQVDVAYRYEPFGASAGEDVRDLLGAPDNEMRFAGEMLDPETDLYHLRAREYDPATGRFTAVDPLDHPVDVPLTSTYVYAENRPTVLIDPLGLRAITGIGQLPDMWGQMSPAQRMEWMSAQLGPEFQSAYGRRYDSVGLGDYFDQVLADPVGTWNDGRNQTPLWAQLVVGGTILVSGGLVACHVVGYAPCVALGSTTVGVGGDRTARVVSAPQAMGPTVNRVLPGLTSSTSSLQHTYSRHAADFGFTGTWNRVTGELFAKVLQTHVTSPGTLRIFGTYRNMPVIHNLDPSTGLNVMQSRTGQLISGWRLSSEQLLNVLNRGSL